MQKFELFIIIIIMRVLFGKEVFTFCVIYMKYCSYLFFLFFYIILTDSMSLKGYVCNDIF